MKRQIKLTYEMLISILQGKDLRLVYDENEIVISPPFDGVFLTYEQIEEIRYSSEERVFNMLAKILNSKEDIHKV